MAPKRLLGAAAVLALTASGCSAGHRGARAPTTTTGVTTTTSPAPPASSTATTGATPTSSTTTTISGGGSRTVTATSPALDVTMTVTPVRGPAGTSVGFSVTAHAGHAAGALGYQLSYGDGATGQNAVPKFCTSGAGAVSEGAWSFTHRYVAPGTYAATVHVSINCSGDQVTTPAVMVAIS